MYKRVRMCFNNYKKKKKEKSINKIIKDLIFLQNILLAKKTVFSIR